MPIAEVPADWSRPRTLCGNHGPLYVEDGELLSDVMGRAGPQNAPLEGSLLGQIYNPVYVIAPDGRPVKVWADYVAGAIRLCEDRFRAWCFFEFWALENRQAVDFLYASSVFARIAGRDDFSHKDRFRHAVHSAADETARDGGWPRKLRRRRRFEQAPRWQHFGNADRCGLEPV